jgi:hypothetical protein
MISYSAWCKKPQIEIVKKVPVELEIAINGLDMKFLDADQYEKLRSFLVDIDGGIRILSKPISDFIIKSETYKTILEHLPLNSRVKNMVKTESFNLIQKRIQNEEKDYSSFSKWLINSLLQDGIDIEKNRKKNSKTMRKKERIIGSWIKVILQFSPEQFNKLSHDIAYKILHNISLYLKIAAKATTGDLTSDFKNLTYFNIAEFLPPKNQKVLEKQNSVIEQINKDKKQRIEEAVKLVEKLKIKPKNPAKSEKPKWTPKNEPTPKTPWTPKEIETKKTEDKPEVKEQKKLNNPEKKGKIFKLDDV